MSDTLATAAEPGIGHNESPDWAAVVTADLAEKYAKEFRNVDDLEAEGVKFLEQGVADDDAYGRGSDLVIRIRKAADTLDSHREAEKAEPEVRYNTINNRFFGAIERLRKRTKHATPGISDLIYAKLDTYNQAKLAREQRRRRQEALDARKDADQAQAEFEVAEQIRIEAERTAARARAPEHIEAKTEIAHRAAEVSAVAQVDAFMAGDRAEQTMLFAKAKPADMVRSRSSGGTLSTMGTEAYAEIFDEKLLNKDELWSHISLAVKQVALNKWAGLNGHSVQMAGAKIGRRPKTRIGG